MNVYPCINLLLNVTQILIKRVILTKILTIKLSFISRIRFHTQMNMNFIKVMKNNIKTQYQIMILVAKTWIKHISEGNGPNHILRLLIPQVTIPYIAAWKKEKNYGENSSSKLARNLRKFEPLMSYTSRTYIGTYLYLNNCIIFQFCMSFPRQLWSVCVCRKTRSN